MSPVQTLSAEAEAMSPNQLAKRDEIITATVGLLLSQGVHGCTVRSIATASGVSNGAVHYYFDDVDEVIDLAMITAISAWVQWIRAVGAASASTPLDIFWQTMSSCLDPFAHGDRTLMPLWLEYWSLCVRKDRLGPLREMQGVLISFVDELLTAAAGQDLEARASGLTAYLFGAGMQQSVGSVGSVPWETISQHIAALSGLDSPTKLPGSQ